MDRTILLNFINSPPPPKLEDEVLFIEKSGEMPQVAFEESLLALGPVSAEDEDYLRAAVIRAYLSIIKRDLAPGSVGKSHFRGLGRAVINLARLKRYLSRLGWPLPDELLKGLADDLTAYLEAEKTFLLSGRPYATASTRDMEALCNELHPGFSGLKRLLGAAQGKPVPDFLGLRALSRLKHPSAAAKRRRIEPKRIIIELLDGDGKRLCGVALPLLNLWGVEDTEALARAKLVWSLLDYAEAEPPAALR